MSTLYWAIVVMMFGGCIGSFLNVVIYRWPRELSVRKPNRSFCPNCTNGIAWYDNLPVISYLILRGRCRHCAKPISLHYPLVEIATALAFLMTYDALFAADMRYGIGPLSSDYVILIAHLLLWAGMIAVSVMDFEAYYVDIRVTWIVSIIGVAAHTLWRPATAMTQQANNWIRPGLTMSVVCIAILIGLVIGWMLLQRALARLPVEEVPDDMPLPDRKPRPGSWPLLLIPVALVAAYLVLMTRGDAAFGLMDADWVRLGGGALLIMISLTLVAAQPDTLVDEAMNETLDAEAPDARLMAVSELEFLLPAILLGAIAFGLMQIVGVKDTASALLYFRAGDNWYPILGLSTAISGWVIAGAIGWGTRLVFTLALGKEAFGMGDVHILAAAGAVAGWPVAFLGFFMAAPLALLAILLMALLPTDGKWPKIAWLLVVPVLALCGVGMTIHPLLAPLILLVAAAVASRRQQKALPYGPWLAIGFFVAFIFQDVLLDALRVRWLFETL